MLVKKCGLDAVKEVMPEEHMKLLTNIRKVVKISANQIIFFYLGLVVLCIIHSPKCSSRREKRGQDLLKL